MPQLIKDRAIVDDRWTLIRDVRPRRCLQDPQ